MSKACLVILLPILFHTQLFPQSKESWIAGPVKDWPHIAMMNHVMYINGDTYIHPSFKYAATGFLVEIGKDTLAATAKHVLWIAKNKKSIHVEINDALKSWTMKPKGLTKDSAVIGRLINEDKTEILEGKGSSILERDWLVFSLKKVTKGIKPLRPRFTPLRPGERVFIVSCSYDDSTATVHQGKIYKKLGMDILIERDMSTHKGGCSGSPVIDSNGYLIGLVSGSTGTNAGNMTYAISTEYLKNILAKKPQLNLAKKDYGQLILSTTLKSGPKKAIAEYKKLVSNPANYYLYNLRSADRNGLREAGEKLLAANKIKEAVEILKFNTEVNSGYFINHNLLAKAQLVAGHRISAISSYENSIKSNSDKNNEAYQRLAELEKLDLIYSLDTSKSKLLWKATQKMGGGHNGSVRFSFGKVITNNENRILGGTFILDMNTISAEDMIGKRGKNEVDGVIKSDEFFSVKQYPTTIMTIKSVTPTASTNQ